MSRRFAVAALALLVGAGCGGGHSTARSASPAGPPHCSAKLHDGASIGQAELGKGCTVGGSWATFSAYTCRDGSTLVVTGDPTAAASGWVRYPAGANTAAWHAGPWQPAHDACYPA